MTSLPSRAAGKLPPPAETCCKCGVDRYEWQLCEVCGYCTADCCQCEQEPSNDDCLWFLGINGDDADYKYDEMRSGQ